MTSDHRRRRRPLEDIPHKQVSDVRTVDVPAQPGVIAHRDYLVTTACRREMPTTLVTREDDRVRCTACKAATAAAPDARPAAGATPQTEVWAEEQTEAVIYLRPVLDGGRGYYVKLAAGQLPDRSDYLRETYHGDILGAALQVRWLMDNVITGTWRRVPKDHPDREEPMMPAPAQLTREEAAYAHLASFARGQRVIVAGRGFCHDGTVTTAQQDGGDIKRAFVVVSRHPRNALAAGDGRPDTAEVRVTVASMLSGPCLTVISEADAATRNWPYFAPASLATRSGES
jgi:hypothetical protein